MSAQDAIDLKNSKERKEKYQADYNAGCADIAGKIDRATETFVTSLTKAGFTREEAVNVTQYSTEVATSRLRRRLATRLREELAVELAEAAKR